MNDQQDTLTSKVAGLAKFLGSESLPSGTLSQLRRLNLSEPDQPAFWSLLATRIDPDGLLSTDGESRWAAILSGMALMSPRHHRRGARLGAVLAECGLKEGRLMRLLRSRGKAFLESVRRTCSFLASCGEAVDWTEFAALILSVDREKAESARRRVARDYYRTLHGKENRR